MSTAYAWLEYIHVGFLLGAPNWDMQMLTLNTSNFFRSRCHNGCQCILLYIYIGETCTQPMQKSVHAIILGNWQPLHAFWRPCKWRTSGWTNLNFYRLYIYIYIDKGCAGNGNCIPTNSCESHQTCMHAWLSLSPLVVRQATTHCEPVEPSRWGWCGRRGGSPCGQQGSNNFPTDAVWSFSPHSAIQRRRCCRPERLARSLRDCVKHSHCPMYI